MVITFEELRQIKDRLPHGSMKKIAAEVGTNEHAVRSYFGGPEVHSSQPVGVHVEHGSNGSMVELDDMRIYEAALKLLK